MNSEWSAQSQLKCGVCEDGDKVVKLTSPIDCGFAEADGDTHATGVRAMSTATPKPLVFLTGDLMAKETAEESQSWKGALGDSVFGRLGTTINLDLVRARARTLGCSDEPRTYRNTSLGSRPNSMFQSI
ncbi:hypothetical protein DB88DRAFT_475783 [Papiliotrema laurentii]|uniref:Uncharacterized protein n=1 Tax=Papiliotrema laurentii TaxID=5418 RepID=A0AAD9FLD1_PAPLA|nr:hypothetical protein DB88DRAFT_475783 [Papiliotrema laurentii]